MSRWWAMVTTLTARQNAAGGARHPQPGPQRRCQMESPGGGAPASPPVFVRGKAAPTKRGVAAASQKSFAPALVRLAFAG